VAAAGPGLQVHRADRPRATIVMAHGVMSHAGWLAPLGRALAARGVTAVAVDRPGSGLARDLPGAVDPKAWVDSLIDALPGHEAGPVALFGWCWGARPAILAAEQAHVDHLVLAAPGLAMAPGIRARAAELASMEQDPLPLPFDVADFSDDAEIVARIRSDELAWTGQPRAFLAPSRAVLDAALAALPRLSMPHTTILADRDRIVDNDAVTRLVTEGTIARLPGGHAVVLETPESVAERVAAAIAP